jgi:dipeptidyl aminopeptidase/acylaminoacyl peptidase
VFVRGFSPDPNLLYVLTARETDTLALAHYDLREGRIVRTLFYSERYDLGGLFGGFSEVHYDRRTREILGLSYEAERTRTVWLDASLRRWQHALEEALPEFVHLPLAWSDDKQVVLYFSRSDRDPGRYLVMDGRVPTIVPLLETNEWLRRHRLAATEVVRVSARDGYELEGYLTLPPGASAEAPVPLLLHPHGGPWARDVWRFDPDVQYLATRGFAVLQVNFRGSGGYGRRHLLAAAAALVGLMIDDMVHAARKVAERREIDGRRMGIFGHSYGGYAAYMAPIRYPGLFRAAAPSMAVTDLDAQVAHYAARGHAHARDFWRTIVGAESAAGRPRERSPVGRVAEIAVPLRIFHGERDPTVPMRQAREMDRALLAAGKDFEITYFKDSGHSYRRQDRLVFLQELTRFFTRHLVEVDLVGE